MTQQEHLQRIRAKCVELLELAKQRTPGRWRVFNSGDPCPGIEADGESVVIWGLNEDEAGVRTGLPDAAFIASAAAGPFEAALASTVASIDDWLSLFDSVDAYADGAPDASDYDKLCNELAGTC